MTQAPVTIFHNPNCSTSRAVLQMIRDTGVEPEVVEYLKIGWTRPQLEDLLREAGLAPRDVLRTHEGLADEMGLTSPDATNEALLGAMVADPILVNRPIVRGPEGTVLARPKEKVLGVL
ncbi:MAG: arsenate reductase (glutaredoxin) [Brevundimonas sp.]|nr:MAG: arsenate reductase (glutaredoxin) [Brevundimonas sp.]